ncbi:PREDICTED: C-type natriuretic peptide-like [Gekko japonicus]|uniref:C-type natriuretic peptide-like n=1 Tax=Gekko japonicus TaxID=146911 RepID=A0ABM1KQ41_GEKJA|nr:PREDICTED: C-type natriuretic peptide-like [Gekko japonicus]
MKATLPLLCLVLLPLVSQSPVHSSQALLELLGEDLAALLSSRERDPPSALQGSFSQLLNRPRPPREPSGAPSEHAWLHLFKDFVNTPKKFRGHTKKMAQQGCFGIKLDRIGTLSGLGC